MRPVLVIMAKEPVAGRVKTRLAESLGTAAATGIYRTMQSSAIARLAHDPRWRTVLSLAPDHAVASRVFPSGMTRVAQGGGDLGARMQRIFDTVGRGPLIIIGTDIPALVPRDIADAFRALQRCDAVLGPARDGGYWLIGLRRFPRVLKPFADVRWSSAFARSDTEANLKTASLAILRTLDDLDTAEDLASLARYVGRRIAPRN